MDETSQGKLMMEEFEMKEEKASIKENSLTLSHVGVEDISTVYVQTEDVKLEGIIRNNKIMIKNIC